MDASDKVEYVTRLTGVQWEGIVTALRQAGASSHVAWTTSMADGLRALASVKPTRVGPPEGGAVLLSTEARVAAVMGLRQVLVHARMKEQLGGVEPKHFAKWNEDLDQALAALTHQAASPIVPVIFNSVNENQAPVTINVSGERGSWNFQLLPGDQLSLERWTSISNIRVSIDLPNPRMATVQERMLGELSPEKYPPEASQRFLDLAMEKSVALDEVKVVPINRFVTGLHQALGAEVVRDKMPVAPATLQKAIDAVEAADTIIDIMTSLFDDMPTDRKDILGTDGETALARWNNAADEFNESRRSAMPAEEAPPRAPFALQSNTNNRFNIYVFGDSDDWALPLPPGGAVQIPRDWMLAPRLLIDDGGDKGPVVENARFGHAPGCLWDAENRDWGCAPGCPKLEKDVAWTLRSRTSGVVHIAADAPEVSVAKAIYGMVSMAFKYGPDQPAKSGPGATTLRGDDVNNALCHFTIGGEEAFLIPNGAMWTIVRKHGAGHRSHHVVRSIDEAMEWFNKWIMGGINAE